MARAIPPSPRSRARMRSGRRASRVRRAAYRRLAMAPRSSSDPEKLDIDGEVGKQGDILVGQQQAHAPPGGDLGDGLLAQPDPAIRRRAHTQVHGAHRCVVAVEQAGGELPGPTRRPARPGPPRPARPAVPRADPAGPQQRGGRGSGRPRWTPPPRWRGRRRARGRSARRVRRARARRWSARAGRSGWRSARRAGAPAARISAGATGCAGRRTATVGAPAVTRRAPAGRSAGRA